MLYLQLYNNNIYLYRMLIFSLWKVIKTKNIKVNIKVSMQKYQLRFI